MKYRLFIDECGDPSLHNINPIFPVFVLLGLLIEETAYLKMCQNVIEIKQKFFSSSNVIFHSRDIRKCEGVFSKLFDLQIKEEFYKEINHLITTTDFQIISVGIKKQEYFEKYGKISDDPYEISLSFLLERAVMEANTKNSVIDIAIESRGKKEDETVQRRYNRLLDIGSGHILPNEFKKVLTDMKFIKKRENDCGLQIADLCAYPVARNLINPNEPYPAFDIIRDKFRKHKNGNFNGYGLKIFP